MRFTGCGHPAIRATHAKTLELSLDAEISERATCVVAVGAQADPAQPLAGAVLVAVVAGRERFEFAATANSSWDPRGPAVIRRSPLRLPGTLASAADAGAADLPAGLRAALRDPTTRVVVELTAAPNRPTVVLFAADSTRARDPRLAAELAAADLVLAEDAGARALADSHQQSNQAAVRTMFRAPARASSKAPADRPPDRLDGRLLVLSTRDLPGRTVPVPGERSADATVWLPDDVALDVVGLPPALAAAAASLGDSPLVLAPAGADPREVLRDAPAAARVLLAADVRRLPEIVQLARQLRGSAAATIVRDTAPPVHPAGDTIPDLPGRGPAFVCFAAAPGEQALDPGPRAAVVGLLADGVPVAAAARALAQLTGWPRRRAYDAVLALRGEVGPPS
ncbi:DUF371 domain-containing protein [uncultured Jatrophihabitans sp.]|uniref:DUF371 domain-containing protein n=1 Tax=uncultured Jatrophihabitans sp. TaxID=1610747 RepID=UPI0035CBAD68